ncbi:AraC family transcriptional regulator [Blastopirellula marina]|uniref:Xylose operon regulatory protein n=1 Tax=Blastopirellula marina DSM 3645 TaxID=314230 RepID=A3ZWJ4_9BACT|nr:DNA-binding transcriptional regulator [Blastopirellula marina]EAQ79222.1 xylose operon regulatory protein [Blastopirellula marina DSM 3645]
MIRRLSVYPDRLRIALLVLNESQWSRSILEGVSRFAAEHGGWDFWLHPRAMKTQALMPADWKGEGIIARIADEHVRASLERHDMPTINVSWHSEQSRRFPKVIADPQGSGELAGNFFVQRGFQHFGYIGPPLCYNYRDPVQPAAERVIEEAGYSLRSFSPDPASPSSDYDYQRSRLVQWVRSLPKPIGVIAFSTVVAREIMLTCSAEGINVPNDVAVLAVEHDPLISQLSPMPISYIQQRPELVGYEAARELRRLISGGTPRDEPIAIAPEGIIEKPSTDTIFAADSMVQNAVAYIKQNADSAINVSDLTRFLDVSRRSLEDRFRKALNRTPAEEIRFARLLVLKDFLRQTNLSLAEISAKSGFSCENSTLRFFKRMTGMTPGEYRRNYDPIAASSRQSL